MGHQRGSGPDGLQTVGRSAELLMVKCDGSHVHQQLIGGRASATEHYTPKLIRAILKGLRRYLISRSVIGALEVGPTVEEPELVVQGSNLRVHGDNITDDGPVAYDEYPGLQLSPVLVKKAREDEIDFLNKLGTWSVVPRSQADDEGLGILRARWVERNKGDELKPFERSRLVLQETKRISSIAAGESIAATPPLEALRFLLSLAMSLAAPAGDDWVIIFIDISRAHPNRKVLRHLYCELPEEAGFDKNQIGFLVMCLYCLRDAAQAFELGTAEVMGILGFTQGMFSPCLRCHSASQIRTWVYGDDFVSLVPRSQGQWFVTELGKHMIGKVLAKLGSRQYGMHPDDKEVRIMNRLVTWRVAREGRAGAIEWETDPRHVQKPLYTRRVWQVDQSGCTTGRDRQNISTCRVFT